MPQQILARQREPGLPSPDLPPSQCHRAAAPLAASPFPPSSSAPQIPPRTQWGRIRENFAAPAAPTTRKYSYIL